MRTALFPALCFLLFAAPAFAEDESAIASKLERLERDITFLQKQVYRGKTADGEISTVSGNAGVESRLAKMAEELRQLRGSVEQVQFASQQHASELKKLSDDVDYRLRAIEDKQNAAAQAAAAAAAAPATSVPTAPAVAAAPETPAKFEPAPKPAPAAKPALTGNDFPDANAHYSAAFKLLNERKYAEAASSFDTFVKKYPGDPLTANAYYWLGESYYARGDFTRSGESFRKGFETNPDGQKAPDNLFKLSKSLTQVKRVNEACIVLGQLSKKYATSAPRVVKLADEERTALQCK